MTFEELKAEANRQGYNLVKKYQPMPKLLKCPICGSLARVNYGDTFYVTCKKGCLIGPKIDRLDTECTNKITGTRYKAQSKPRIELAREAREAWNEMIENSLPAFKEEENASRN